MLRGSGRKLFLATNSLWDYTHIVMNYLLTGRVGAERNEDWLEYFDAAICGAPQQPRCHLRALKHLSAIFQSSLLTFLVKIAST